MWRRGLLYTLLAATVAATATDGATKGAFLVQKTPCEKTMCKIARNPGSLDIAGLKLRAQRMSSCACEMAYALYIFISCLGAYFMAKTAAERLEKFKHLVRVLSVFLVHYSRDLAIAQIPVPLLAAMELTTTLRASKGDNLGDRPACDIVARQNEAGFSFWAGSVCSDRLLTSRYAVNVLAYSEPARRWPTISVLFYNTHNGGGGGVRISMNLGPVVALYVHRNSGGHLPEGAPLRILSGDPGDAPKVFYDLDRDAIDEDDAAADRDAIVDDDAAAEADCDGDAAMADAPPPAALAVVPFGGAFAPAASALDAFPAPHVTFVVAPPPLRVFGARGAADDVLDARFFLDKEDCDEQPSAATASAGPALQDLRALLRAPTSTARHAAVDGFGASAAPSLGFHVAQLLAAEAPRHVVALGTCGVAAGGLLTDARDASSVRGTVLDTDLARPTARNFARDAPPAVSLLLARGADARSGAHNASGSHAPLHLSAGNPSATSTEADPPDGATPADGPPDAVDATVPAALATAAPALDPAKKASYEKALKELKEIRDNMQKTGHHGGNGKLQERLDGLAKGLQSPDGHPMNNQGKYMVHKYWTAQPAAPGKRKATKKALRGPIFRDSLITELEALLGLESSAADEALDDDDDDGVDCGYGTSVDEARRCLRNMTGGRGHTAMFLKKVCDNFEVDYSKVRNRGDEIKRVLIERLEKILADADEEISVGARAMAAMAAIEAEAVGNGLEATEEEFSRVLGLVAGELPPPLALGEDLFSLLFGGLVPSAPNEASRPQRQRRAAAEKTLDVVVKLVTFLDINDVNALQAVSRVGLALMPQRKALTMWARRWSAVDEATDPKTFQTLLTAPFLAVNPNAPEPEVIQKCKEIALDLIYNSGRRTAIEDAKGRLSTPGEIVRNAVVSVPYSRLIYEQLLLKKGDRDDLFRDLKNEHIQCTTDTQIKAHVLAMLLELYVAKILRGATNHRLDEVVSKPSSQVEVTLRTSLGTWRDVSPTLRTCFMDPKKLLESGDYGNARKHSTKAARDIIKNASAAIEARLAELTKGYAGEFDEAVEFFLERFKPEGEAQVAEAAAWRSWLDDPRHVASVARKATGQVQPKVKRAEVGRAKAPKSRGKISRRKH